MSKPVPFFLSCGAYGIALSLLIFSSFFTYSLIEFNLFEPPYSPGRHELTWLRWHGTGCLFAGLINVLAGMGGWNRVAKRSLAIATAVLYGIWSFQNLQLCLYVEQMQSLMWIHVFGCALVSIACFIYWLRSRSE